MPTSDAEPTRWLTEDERRVWLAFIATMIRLPRALDRQLERDANLTHFEYQVLVMLADEPTRQLRMTALADRTEGALPRLSQVVRRMEKEGLVRRLPDLSDRRCTIVELSERGWKKLVASAPGHVDAVRRLVFDPLTSSQAEGLRKACERILAAGFDVDGLLA